MKRFLACLAAVGAVGLGPQAFAGTPQSPALDGPFSIPTAWSTQTDPVSGQNYQVPTTFSGNHWNTTPAFYAACPALAPYTDASRPLTRVWAGDSPSAPTQTVPLVFPDATTAETVLLSCGATEPVQ